MERNPGLRVLKYVWVTKGHQYDLYLEISQNTIICCYHAAINLYFNKVKLYLNDLYYRINQRENNICPLSPKIDNFSQICNPFSLPMNAGVLYTARVGIKNRRRLQ